MIDAALSSCLKFEDAITLKETVDLAKKAGLNKENAEKWLAEIGSKEKELVEDLVGKAMGKMLYDCGLGPFAHALWNREMSGDINPIATYPGLSKQELQRSLQVSLMKIFSCIFYKSYVFLNL
jgi:DNA-binding phage protein